VRAASLASVLLLVFLSSASAQALRDLRLAFVGDIMAHNVNTRMSDYQDIYRGVADIFHGCDLVAANLEFPIDSTRPTSGYPLFNGDPAYVRAAVESGIQVFSVANNHAFDAGEEGVFQTLRAFAALSGAASGALTFSGIRGNQHRPFLPETRIVNGVRVGFLAVTQFLNEPDAGRYVNVVDYSDDRAVQDLLQLVRSVSPLYGLFIVSYHGDREYAQEPSPLKRAFFQELLEAGAHIVFSHHPHVVQRYEVVRVKGVERLIMYSMGNFISGMTWMLGPAHLRGAVAATGESYILMVDVRCAAGGCSVRGVEPIPIANYMNERNEMVVARMSDLAEGTIVLSPGWQEYFAGRLALMESFLGVAASPDQPVDRE